MSKELTDKFPLIYQITEATEIQFDISNLKRVSHTKIYKSEILVAYKLNKPVSKILNHQNHKDK